MKCEKCDTLLSIHDLEKNEWVDDSEIFYIKCPVCETTTKLISNLFEDEHISQQYLGLIVSDSKTHKKEKYVDYIPEVQRKKLFEHLETCDICKSRIEAIRLAEISKEIEFNEKTYNFFISKAKDVIKQLEGDKLKLDKDNNITSFVFENEEYKVNQEDLFYQKQELLNGSVEFERSCYSIQKENFYVGMVSFVKSNDRNILEKIWLKSEQRIEKEKEFIKNLRSGKFRILFRILQKIPLL